MLRRILAVMVSALLAPILLVAPAAVADGESPCPPGTDPVHVGSGVICIVVTDSEDPEVPADPADPAGGGEGPAGCFKSDGTEVPCQTSDGYWWSGYQCYAAPYDAPPGSPAWQGHTDGSVWQCSSCTGSGTTGSCNVQIIWVPPGDEPGPPSPEQLAATALGLLRLPVAEVRTAPAAPAATYVGVETWLWVPDAQWGDLSKSVSAGATTVTVVASPAEVVWGLGPTSLACDGPGTPWVRGMTDSASTSCGFTFERTSAREPGGTFSVAATIRYAVSWICSGACPTTGGDLGLVDSPAGASTMRVLQRQAVVVR